jgi:L,D-peptidoglycan transpeptidase YkuD (ErfK/YbiS/YcfS/YnhG family)
VIVAVLVAGLALIARGSVARVAASGPHRGAAPSATDRAGTLSPQSPLAVTRSATRSARPLSTPRTGRTSSPARTPAPATTGSRPAGGLPLAEPAAAVRQVITVVAASKAATTATVRAWARSGTGWVPASPGTVGYVGSAGLTTTPSEGRPATPLGSFQLSEAFGARENPGTALPYLHTDSSDWWISEPGTLYNTHQRCSAGCSFTLGAPNEHLAYQRPAYDYAVVIGYNTASAGPVVAGAGSAFFLHVSNGAPTAGCVSVPEAVLVSLMRWLKPADHPRILIGLEGGNR